MDGVQATEGTFIIARSQICQTVRCQEMQSISLKIYISVNRSSNNDEEKGHGISHIYNRRKPSDSHSGSVNDCVMTVSCEVQSDRCGEFMYDTLASPSKWVVSLND